jgi:hypothetical protein
MARTGIKNEKGFTKICKALIFSVENIGVEPMTSSPNAFGAFKRSIKLR